MKNSLLGALRGSTGSARPERVEGRASAVQFPSPASHGSLKTQNRETGARFYATAL